MRLPRLCLGLSLLLLAADAPAIEPETPGSHAFPLPGHTECLDQDEPASPDSTAEAGDEKEKDAKGLPLKAERSFRIATDEVSWMSVDVSEDGKSVVFDFLGDIFTVPFKGGAATQITRGLAFDSQPRFHPAGDRIVLVSDRDGGDNVWVLWLDGSDSTQITKGKAHRYQSPEWTPDGKYIVASKSGGRFGQPMPQIYDAEGGSGAKLFSGADNLKVTGVAFGADDRYVWYAQRFGGWNYNAQFPQYQIGRHDRLQGTNTVFSNHYGSAFRPTLSPDGRWLVFGTRHDEETGLILRDLVSGAERWLAYPVQHDEQEARGTRDVLPGMSFTPDSKELVASYGGKLWRIPIDGGAPLPIAVHIETDVQMGPLVDFDYEIEDSEQFVVRQIRDAAPSPDGKQLAFIAMDRLYLMDYPNGEPQRLTNEELAEHMPTWSPDGKSIAYVTWTRDGGHIKAVRARGRANRPNTLSETPGFYMQPAWSPDGRRVVALYGAAQILQSATGPAWGVPGASLIWIDAEGGPLQTIDEAKGRYGPHFRQDDDRIYLSHGERGLLSIRFDGSDERSHLKVTGHSLPSQENPTTADFVLMNPLHATALAHVDNQLYVITVPLLGTTPEVSIADLSAASFPVRKLTDVGGQFAGWTADGDAVHWSIGNAHFRYDLATAKAAEDSVKAAKKAEEAAKKDEADTKEEKEDEAKKKEKEKPAYTPRELRIVLQAPRDIPRGSLLLSGARVVTMNGDEIFEHGDILIHDNRIAAIGQTGAITVPAGTATRDVTGKTIVPGFVDTHSHMWPSWSVHNEQVWQYEANLAYGVTTTRDPQTATTDVLSYGDMVTAGRMKGPRIYSTGPGVFWDEPIEDLDHARNILRRYSDYYDTKTIKMYVAGNREQRQWIIQAAKELELMPTTEGSLDFKLNLTQILDGYPGHEHCFPVYPLYEDVIQLCVQSGVTYTPTLLVAYGGPFAENYWYATEEVHDDGKLRTFTPHLEIDQKTLRRPWFRAEQHVFEEQAVFVKDLVEAGGRAGVGSHGQLQGLGYHWELWSMASGGLRPHDALKCATIFGAMGIGLDQELGSLEPGKLADLIVLDRNPLEDIRHSNSVRWVMKNGRLYDGDTLDELWPREQAHQRAIWWAPEPATAAGLHSVAP